MSSARNLFIFSCMIIIAASLAFASWSNFNLNMADSLVVFVVVLVVQMVGYLFFWKTVTHRALLARLHDLTLSEAENANNVERLSNELAGLRKTSKKDTQKEVEPLTRELEVVSTLIKQLAEEQTAAENRLALVEHQAHANNLKMRSVQDKTAHQGAPHADDQPSAAPQPLRDTNQTPLNEAPADTNDPSDQQSQNDTFDNEPKRKVETLNEQESSILDAVNQAVESNQVDLYLQPIVTLPQRKPIYYEALTRIRDDQGQLIRPSQFLESAQTSGSMPVLDKMLLVRAIQVLRRLLLRKSDAVIICNISAKSLADNHFFNDLKRLLRAKPDLANHLIFEFNQQTVAHFDTLEEESLHSLKVLGFRFAVDNVTDLTFDFVKLSTLGFHFVKISSRVLLAAKKTGIKGIHAEDFSRYLIRNGLQLIVDQVEKESEVVELLEYDLGLGQGHLFAAPREVKPDIFTPARQQKVA